MRERRYPRAPIVRVEDNPCKVQYPKTVEEFLYAVTVINAHSVMISKEWGVDLCRRLMALEARRG